MWTDDGRERKRERRCGTCNEGVVETVEHVLMQCEAFREERDEWWRGVREVVGGGSLPSSSCWGGGALV